MDVTLDPQGVFKQALRYLAAAVQDAHPLFGLCHANYARILLEELARAGAPVKTLLKIATRVQDKYSMQILAKFPFRQLPAAKEIVDTLLPADLIELSALGL
jgi:hypothetical protein